MSDNSDGYEVDDSPDRIDVDAVCRFLRTEPYWGRWRTEEIIRTQVARAWRVVGAYDPTGALVGFARAMSDGFGVAYLADVYVLDDHRGHGLGKRIIGLMIDDGPGADFRWMLHTNDAHGLYARFGFGKPDPTYMDRPGARRPDLP
ncbi:GNAT family N-acetyltransferase [Pseudonocardia spinosispora]|uniref:GNAT family N-acetyltransferase n=1 Tax=Pseudonocardia spinosispora TaxID=103441 RepID=UPI00048B14D4|nr:GNAT family N-acetyltransferase [Pseudonocardia spinosispora]